MTCERCGLEMRIARHRVEPQDAGQGVVRVEHVNELRCVNKQCAGYGRMRESRVLVWEGALVPCDDGTGQADGGGLPEGDDGEDAGRTEAEDPPGER